MPIGLAWACLVAVRMLTQRPLSMAPAESSAGTLHIRVGLRRKGGSSCHLIDRLPHARGSPAQPPAKAGFVRLRRTGTPDSSKNGGPAPAPPAWPTLRGLADKNFRSCFHAHGNSGFSDSGFACRLEVGFVLAAESRCAPTDRQD